MKASTQRGRTPFADVSSKSSLLSRPARGLYPVCDDGIVALYPIDCYPTGSVILKLC
jgi:hypothetical protein